MALSSERTGGSAITRASRACVSYEENHGNPVIGTDAAVLLLIHPRYCDTATGFHKRAAGLCVV